MFGVQLITRRFRFCFGVLKIQRIEYFSMQFEGNSNFRKIYYSALKEGLRSLPF